MNTDGIHDVLYNKNFHPLLTEVVILRYPMIRSTNLSLPSRLLEAGCGR